MPISTTISRSYAIKMIAASILCLVFGVWGIVDYVWVIPGKQRKFDQFQVLTLTKAALEGTNPTAGKLTDDAAKADQAINDEWGRVTGRPPRETSPQEVLTLMEKHPDAEWLKFLFTLKVALPIERTPPLDDQSEVEARKALEVVDNRLNAMKTVSPPSPLDRATQWFFIASLPCAPWLFWAFIKARRQKYTLNEQGTLEFIGDSEHGSGAWTQDEMAEIDMHRWMAKSIAWLVHQDGRRMKLDAYLHKDLHLIIGAIASRMHPDEWDAEAKPVKSDLSGPPAAGGSGEVVAAGSESRLEA